MFYLVLSQSDFDNHAKEIIREYRLENDYESHFPIPDAENKMAIGYRSAELMGKMIDKLEMRKVSYSIEKDL